MNILEHTILPFDFSMIGKFELNIQTGNPATLELGDPLTLIPDGTPIELLCARWSERPDIIACTPRYTPNLTFTLSNLAISDESADERATAQLRILYKQKGIPWPE